MFNLCYSLSSYLYFLVIKKSLRLQVYYTFNRQFLLTLSYFPHSASVCAFFFPLNRNLFFSCNFLSQVSDASSSYPTSVELQQPTLSLLNSLLSSVTTALERAAEEKSVLLNKVKMQRNLSLYLLQLILSTLLPF